MLLTISDSSSYNKLVLGLIAVLFLNLFTASKSVEFGVARLLNVVQSTGPVAASNVIVVAVLAVLWIAELFLPPGDFH